jgi:ADP-ribose pyrophosphatase
LTALEAIKIFKNNIMKHENPWKTLSSKTVYKNPWITVREDQVITPTGTTGIYGVVESRIATGVVALTPENEIYLVGQYRYPTNHYSWEIIEGGGDPHESALTTAKRELLEEAGLTANSWEQLGGEIHLSNCYSSEIGFLFIARDLTLGTSNPDETEVLDLQKIPLKKCFEMLDSGEIKDAMSIIALHRLKEVLKGNKA